MRPRKKEFTKKREPSRITKTKLHFQDAVRFSTYKMPFQRVWFTNKHNYGAFSVPSSGQKGRRGACAPALGTAALWLSGRSRLSLEGPNPPPVAPWSLGGGSPSPSCTASPWLASAAGWSRPRPRLPRPRWRPRPLPAAPPPPPAQRASRTRRALRERALRSPGPACGPASARPAPPGPRPSPASSGSKPGPRPRGTTRCGDTTASSSRPPTRPGSGRAEQPQHRRPAARRRPRPRLRLRSPYMLPPRPRRTAGQARALAGLVGAWRQCASLLLPACAMTHTGVTPASPRLWLPAEILGRRSRVVCCACWEGRCPWRHGHVAGSRGGAPERDGRSGAGERAKYGLRACVAAWGVGRALAGVGTAHLPGPRACF
jgi:hypothetical protein